MNATHHLSLGQIPLLSQLPNIKFTPPGALPPHIFKSLQLSHPGTPLVNVLNNILILVLIEMVLYKLEFDIPLLLL